MSSFAQGALIFMETKGTNIIVSIVALVFGVLIINNIMKMLKMAVVDSKLEKSMVKLVLTILQFLLYFMLVIYILSKLGIGITGIVAAFSAFSLAIGLAIQDVIGGLANGLVIISTRPFKVGDYVQIGSISGTVQEINIMHTVLDTPDKKHIFLPNKTVYNSSIENYTTNPIRRIDYEFGVDYGNDFDMVKQKFTELVQNDPLVVKEPAPVVFLSRVDACEIVYKFRVWVRNENYWPLNNSLPQKAFDVCNKNNIAIAFPQLTLSTRPGETTFQLEKIAEAQAIAAKNQEANK